MDEVVTCRIIIVEVLFLPTEASLTICLCYAMISLYRLSKIKSNSMISRNFHTMTRGFSGVVDRPLAFHLMRFRVRSPVKFILEPIPDPKRYDFGKVFAFTYTTKNQKLVEYRMQQCCWGNIVQCCLQYC